MSFLRLVDAIVEGNESIHEQLATEQFVACVNGRVESVSKYIKYHPSSARRLVSSNTKLIEELRRLLDWSRNSSFSIRTVAEAVGTPNSVLITGSSTPASLALDVAVAVGVGAVAQNRLSLRPTGRPNNAPSDLDDEPQHNDDFEQSEISAKH